MIGYTGFTVIQATVSCLQHQCEMVCSKDLIYCERCFGTKEIGQEIENLVQRAQWGLMREPMSRAA